MKSLLHFKDEVAKEMGYNNYAEAKKKAFISNELEKAFDMVAERFAHQFKAKSDKWDKLGDKIGTAYTEEDDEEGEYDLGTIGEWAASAFRVPVIRKGDTFRNDEFQIIIKILDFLPGGKIQIEYTRKGHTSIDQMDPKQLQNLLNPELYKRD